jgi:hypothetical protein
MDDKLNYIEWLRKLADYIEQGDFKHAYLCNMLYPVRVRWGFRESEREAAETFAEPYPDYAERVLKRVAKLGDHPDHGIGEILCAQYGLEPTYDLVRCKSLRVRFLRELADAEAAKVHSPELVRACHEAVACLHDDMHIWLCSIALNMADREAAKALQRAINSALDCEPFLPSRLNLLGLYPKPAWASESEVQYAEWRKQSRLWWLNQILNGYPVPGAA